MDIMDTESSYDCRVYELLQQLDRKLDDWHESILNQFDQQVLRIKYKPKCLIQATKICIKHEKLQDVNDDYVEPEKHLLCPNLTGESVPLNSKRNIIWSCHIAGSKYIPPRNFIIYPDIHLYATVHEFNNWSMSNIYHFETNQWIHLYTFDLDADGYNEIISGCIPSPINGNGF